MNTTVCRSNHCSTYPASSSSPPSTCLSPTLTFAGSAYYTTPHH
jgi:hypothetical protein